VVCNEEAMHGSLSGRPRASLSCDRQTGGGGARWMRRGWSCGGTDVAELVLGAPRPQWWAAALRALFLFCWRRPVALTRREPGAPNWRTSV